MSPYYISGYNNNNNYSNVNDKFTKTAYSQVSSPRHEDSPLTTGDKWRMNSTGKINKFNVSAIFK